MTRPRRRPRTTSVALAPGERQRVEALTVAMALAPGVYARNRMFSLFANAGVQRAKARAATLRGIVKHLSRACAVTLESLDPARHERGELEYVLRYEIPPMRLTRVVELSRTELAALRILAARAGAVILPLEEGDRPLVESTLAQLMIAGGDPGTLARAARESAAPPAE